MDLGSVKYHSPIQSERRIKVKKLLLIIPVILILSLLFASPAFAVDPPDTQVDVTVVTPGDVGLNVDINAGGDVTAIVDGVDLHQTAATAQSASAMAWDSWQKWVGADFMSDYVYYWKITGIGPMVEGRLAELEALAGLLTNAQAKVIQGYQLTNEEVASITVALKSVKENTGVSFNSINAAIGELKVQDDVTWNQLMFGAEAHIADLELRFQEQVQVISQMKADADYMRARAEVSDLNHANLLSYTDYLQRQYLNYFWVAGGVGLLLVACVIFLSLRKRLLF